ncbi:hypothetical protein ACQV5M_22490, partial [Leptospira sp. SA-E8]|uniref:hypothetical protein n=1 Tax=Leptospira sp. SA-E8 TaxID=3422259 RepID=UPI003EBD6A90
YVPALLPYTELCAAVTGLIAIAGFMIYVQQFYGLSRLPRPWSTFWTRMVAVLLGAYVITRAFGWYDLPVMTSIGLWVIGGFFAVLLHRQRHRAMAWAGAGLMALQLLSQYVFHLDKITPWSADYSPQLALLSSLV